MVTPGSLATPPLAHGRSSSDEAAANGPTVSGLLDVAALLGSDSSQRCTARCSWWCERLVHCGGGAGLQGVEEGTVSESERTRLVAELSSAGEPASSCVANGLTRPGTGALAAIGRRAVRAAAAGVSLGSQRAGAAALGDGRSSSADARSGGCAPADADSQKADRPGTRGGSPRRADRPLLSHGLFVWDESLCTTTALGHQLAGHSAPH